MLLRFVLFNFLVYPMFGGTLQRKPFGKDAVVGFKTSATTFYEVAFINLIFRHGLIISGPSRGKDGYTLL